MKLRSFKTASALALVLSFSVSAPAGKPIYAKKAVGFPIRCWSDQIKECRALHIPSPDGQSVVRIGYHKEMIGRDFILLASFQITQKDGTRTDVGAPGLVEGELLWSPDSRSFLINWSNALQGEQGVEVYRLNDLSSGGGNGEWRNVVAAAQRDMLKSFPPCQAKNSDPQDCANLLNHPEAVDVAAVAWTRRSSAIVVLAEIPCSSRFGGIMCEVLGYELDASTGKILRRMDPKEFAREWQPSLAWKFHDPGPPEYQGK